MNTVVGSDIIATSKTPRRAHTEPSTYSAIEEEVEPSSGEPAGDESMDVDKIHGSETSPVFHSPGAGKDMTHEGASAVGHSHVAKRTSPPGDGETSSSLGDLGDVEARPSKRPKLLPDEDASSGQAATSSPEPNSLSSPLPPAVKISSNNTLKLLSLRASPSRSTRPLPSINSADPSRPSKIPSGGKGVQLTLTQTLKGFKASVSGNARYGGPVHTVEESSDEEDELMQHAPKLSPRLGNTRTSTSRDGVQTLVPPISSLPPDLPSSSSEPRETIAEDDLDEAQAIPDTPSTGARPSVLYEVDAPLVEILRNTDSRHLYAAFDLSRVSSFWASLATSKQKAPPNSERKAAHTVGLPTPLKEAGVSASTDQAATNALSRVISKDDFKPGAMEVIGQFNLGFIIARLHRASSGTNGAAVTDDLFIIDQHASDEKYNYETLQQTTKIHSQSLLRYCSIDHYSVVFPTKAAFW